GWRELLSEEELEVYEAFHGDFHLGSRPALLVIDVNYAWTGPAPGPITEALRTFNTACGEQAWAAVPKIRQLIDRAHERSLPVIYTTTLETDRRRPPYPGRSHDGR